MSSPRMDQQFNQETVSTFLADCLQISGVSPADNMKIETLGVGSFIATAPDTKRFLVIVQELPANSETPVLADNGNGDKELETTKPATASSST